jgi:hypothetical protein
MRRIYFCVLLAICAAGDVGAQTNLPLDREFVQSVVREVNRLAEGEKLFKHLVEEAGRGPAIDRESAQRLREGRADRPGPSSAERARPEKRQGTQGTQPRQTNRVDMQRLDNEAIQQVEREAKRARLIEAVADALTGDPKDKVGFIAEMISREIERREMKQQISEAETRAILKAAEELERQRRAGQR